MDRRVQIAIAMMKDNLHRELTLDELARSVDLSLSRLHHLFKAETSTTPAHYLQMLRIEQAKDLLESTTLGVKQIMIRVGVRDKSHFTRGFKKAYGLTPTQYRKAVRLITSVKKT